jgi:putative redox protein
LKTKVKWDEGVRFTGSSESGHSVILDGPLDSGGVNKGMRPMEMMLISIGACTSFDVVTILKKSRQKIEDCEAEITATRSENIPKVFTKIHIHFVIKGANLDSSAIERAIKLSSEKYCSASIMLSKSVQITHDFKIFK